MATVAQADPNGLFAPASADGTWVMCLDPKTKEVKPVYIEPRVIVTPFELPEDEVAVASPKSNVVPPKRDK